MSLFPFVLAAAAGALVLLVWGILKLMSRSRGNRPLRIAHILLILVPLAVIDGIACLYFMIASGLSHSSAKIAAVPMKCLATTAVLVIAPAAGLLLVRHRQIRKSGPDDAQARDHDTHVPPLTGS